MATVKLVNLRKVYGSRVEVIRKLNLEIRDREFTVLVGPSGSGKSTILRMIAGLEEVTDGEIYVDDTIINDVSPRDRDIAMVFQDYALYPHMDVYGNIAFGLKMRKVPRDEIARRVNETATVMGIQHLLRRKPGQISGGERQRVALGRAIVRHPKVFLLDEPLSNLDARLRAQVRMEILRLHRRLNATVLYVTHDQTEAMTMGTTIVVLKDGAVQQADTPRELYTHPANTFVASFIGTPAINLIRAHVTREGDGIVLRWQGGSMALPVGNGPPAALAGCSGAGVLVGIRPEHIQVLPDGQPADGGLAAEVEIVEDLGPESCASVVASCGNLLAKVPSETPLRVGETVHLGFDVERLHFFDAGDGHRIATP